MKTNNFCALMDTINVRRQSIGWEKIGSNYILWKGLVSRLGKEFLQLNNEDKWSNLKTGKGPE